MENSGILRKMNVANGDRVQYWLNLDNEPVLGLNELIGQEVSLIWTGSIFCIQCGKSIKKTFGQGFCYNCFTESAAASPCIIRPELCEAHLEKGRDVAWELRNHKQPHVVYLAQTSGVKVGVTRDTQVPTRWIDQGAWRTIVIAKTPYRQLAGKIEVELKQYLSDRTDWRKMLRDERGTEDIKALREELVEFLPASLLEFADRDSDMETFHYPVEAYPAKVSSVKLENNALNKVRLSGIRGQYLYFEENQVINLRKYSGYEVQFNA